MQITPAPIGAPPLILASSSPRRRALLDEAGYRFRVEPPRPEAECGLCGGESPPQLVARLAYQKGVDVAGRVRSGLLVACDTVAECRGQILGKPADERHAGEMLRALRGREHAVYSGLLVWHLPDGEPALEVVRTRLKLDDLSDAVIDEYLASGQWEGKAGGFGFQDRLGWVHVVEGSASNVVGLPLEALARLVAPWSTSGG